MPDESSWRRYLRFWGRDVDADVDDELRFHLEMLERDLAARGLPPDAARREARRRFGDPERVGSQLRAHDHRRLRGDRRRETMGDLLQDLRYALRGLRRAPGFTLVAVLTLALGIGATTAIFSVVSAVVLRPLPYPEAERVVMVWMDNHPQQVREDIHAFGNYTELRDQGRAAFAAMAAFRGAGYNVTGGCAEGGACEPQRVRGVLATPDLFAVLGVQPALGRAYEAREAQPGNDGVVVISHGLWTRLLAADPRAVGRTIRLNGRERTVVGVMPKGFAFPSRETDVWAPLALTPEEAQQHGSFSYTVVGRLAPGVTLARANADLRTIWTRLQAQYPRALSEYGLNLVPLPAQVVGPALRTALWLMLGAVALVLLVGCANVANLMLSRAAVREREVSVRLALGASRSRLVRQLLTESVLLSLLGGVLGVGLAWVGLRVLLALAPATLPRLDGVRLDAPVLVVTTLVALGTGLLFGLAPALQASRPDLSGALREGGRGGTAGRRGHRLRHLLVASQLALVVVLLTGAGLLLRSFERLQRVELGLKPEGVLTARVSLPAAKYKDREQRLAFFDAVFARLRAQPGVTGVAATTDILLGNTPNSTSITVEGAAPDPTRDRIEVPFDVVTPDYFQVMGVPLRRGRAFTAADRDTASNAQVAIVNESLARRFWPGQDAVGRRFKYGRADDEGPWLTVVGVVGDVRRTGLDEAVRFDTFLPHAQNATGSLTLVVRTAGDPAALATPLRAAVRAVDPEQPVYEVRPATALLDERVAQRRFTMALLLTFAALALVLGVVGVYGVTSYLVAQRTKEVGVRIALGAQPAQLVRMVVGQGMRAALLGLAAGLAGSLLLARLIAGLLYGVSAFDPTTLLLVTLVLASATFVANWLPARRAARVDPLVALRAD